MNRLLLPLVAFTALFSAQLRAADSPAKPNIVLIFIDDMGYGDIGPFGSTKNRTPNLDRMAKEGMKLTSFYAAPVCSVSRAQVITGCYGQRVSLPGVLFPGSPNGISKSEHTVAEPMRAQGYATMCRLWMNTTGGSSSKAASAISTSAPARRSESAARSRCAEIQTKRQIERTP